MSKASVSVALKQYLSSITTIRGCYLLRYSVYR